MALDNPNIGPQGTPSLQDFYSQGAEFQKSNGLNLKTPRRMVTSVDSARVYIHQNQNETGKIGVPGTTYANHLSDDVIHTAAGHTIALGNAPGQETIVIQSASGARIELDSQSSIKLVGDGSCFLSMGADFQITLHGNLNIATNGDFRVKCNQYIIDCHDYHATIGGSKCENIQGDENSNVTADRHHFTNGDHSHLVGGDSRTATAGNVKDQVVGDRRVHTAGKHETSSKGDMLVETLGEMNHVSQSDMKMGSLGKMIMKSKDDYSCDTNGKHSTTSDKDMSSSSNTSIIQTATNSHTVNAANVVSVASQSEVRSSQGSQMFQSGPSGTTISSGTSNTPNGTGSISLKTSGVFSTSAASALSTTHPSANQSFNPLSSLNPPAAASNTQASIVPPNPAIPDANTIHKQLGDLLFTGSIYQIDNENSLYINYYEDGEQDPPQNVLDRAKEHGLQYELFKAQQVALASQAEQATEPKYDLEPENDTRFYPL